MCSGHIMVTFVGLSVGNRSTRDFSPSDPKMGSNPSTATIVRGQMTWFQLQPDLSTNSSFLRKRKTEVVCNISGPKSHAAQKWIRGPLQEIRSQFWCSCPYRDICPYPQLHLFQNVVANVFKYCAFVVFFFWRWSWESLAPKAGLWCRRRSKRQAVNSLILENLESTIFQHSYAVVWRLRRGPQSGKILAGACTFVKCCFIPPDFLRSKWN